MPFTPYHVNLDPIEPKEIPGLVSFWDFDQSGTHLVAQQGEPYCLVSQSGELDVLEDADCCGGSYLEIKEGQWLSIDRKDCPKLDIHGKDGELTVIAWLYRDTVPSGKCEFIAGQWNESNLDRQYGLFLNIRVWAEADRIFGHLSNVGGPTPGFKYCMDGPMGSSEIKQKEWNVIGMSYDGHVGRAWLNGHQDGLTELNPYSLSGGLHDGGPNGSDFTVGAVNRSGVIGNFFAGRIAALAVYERALTPAEMYALSYYGVVVPEN
jgi:hypothetical protein